VAIKTVTITQDEYNRVVEYEEWKFKRELMWSYMEKKDEV